MTTFPAVVVANDVEKERADPCGRVVKTGSYNTATIGVSCFLPVLLVGMRIRTGSGGTGRKLPAPRFRFFGRGDFRKKLGKLSRPKKADGFCSGGVSRPIIWFGSASERRERVS